jgi:phosphotransacetylase
MPNLQVGPTVQGYIQRAKAQRRVRVAVVHPCSHDALAGVVEAAHEGLIEPVLVGPWPKLEKLSEEAGLDLKGFERIDVAHSHEAAARAVVLAGQNTVQALMKGSLHTDELMSEVVKQASGLRTARRISHVFLMLSASYHKPFLITDAAVNIAPDLLTKRDIVQNAVDLLVDLEGPQMTPRVAVLSAIETVNPDMRSTVDAACLAKMADRGQITGALVDGPLAFDNAISAAAAERKGIHSAVSGEADILLAPDLEAGNMMVKQLVFLGQAVSAGLVVGARVPIVLTSRADGAEARLLSCALAVLAAGARSRR